MLSLILAESSLELVPKELQQHPAVLSHAKKLGKKPSEILLDNSWDYAAMKGIKNEIKRGRPDLLHLCLLQSCSIPLYHKSKIQVYIHTIDDKVIKLGKNVRLPKSFHRFLGLLEKLYKEKTIKVQNDILLEITEMNFSQLIDKINPTKVIALSTEGKQSTYSDVAGKLDDNSCLVVGGFQKGHFFDSTKNRFDDSFKVDLEPLDAHVVIGRTLYEYEKTIFM